MYVSIPIYTHIHMLRLISGKCNKVDKFWFKSPLDHAKTYRQLRAHLNSACSLVHDTQWVGPTYRGGK